MLLTQKKFDEARQLAEEKYAKIGAVSCPYLKREVVFNVKGLEHIKSKSWKKARLIADQYTRLKLIELAPQIIGRTTTLQEFTEKRSLERVRSNQKWIHKMVEVKYYAFISHSERSDVRVKIIVKEIVGKGQPYFWSIIPFWKQQKDPLTGQIQKIFSNSDLEQE